MPGLSARNTKHHTPNTYQIPRLFISCWISASSRPTSPVTVVFSCARRMKGITSDRLPVRYVFCNAEPRIGQVKSNNVAHAEQLAEQAVRVVVRNTFFIHEFYLQHGAFGIVAGIAEREGIDMVDTKANTGIVVVVGSVFIRIDRVFVAHFGGAVAFLVHVGAAHEFGAEQKSGRLWARS